MNVTGALDELRLERDRLSDAIVAFERLAARQTVRRRGRPPAWIVAAKQATGTKRRGRPPGRKNAPRESPIN